MPGKKGVKMIPRKSTSGKYRSVKQLVFSLLEKNPNVDREEVEKIVMKEYPNANFCHKDGKGGHFPWYRHKFMRMKLEEAGFNVKEATEPKQEEIHETGSDASQESGIGDTHGMGTDEMGKDTHRTQNRRSKVSKNKRRTVDVKTRKTVSKSRGNSKSA